MAADRQSHREMIVNNDPGLTQKMSPAVQVSLLYIVHNILILCFFSKPQ